MYHDLAEKTRKNDFQSTFKICSLASEFTVLNFGFVSKIVKNIELEMFVR